MTRFPAVLSVGLMVLGAGVVSGQNYPTKPIRIVTHEPGGGIDFAARLIAQGLTANLGQQLIVDNRAGNVIIPAQIVAQAPPDGYTLLSHGNNFWLATLIRKNVPYDPVRDFSPISSTASTLLVLVVHTSSPVKSVKELIALAKSRPGELNYGSSETGAQSHLAAELFKAMAGVNIVRIPYKSGAGSVNALIGGEVQLAFPSAAGVRPHVKSGKLRALAVTSAQPSALVPGLPTVAASGLPGYEAVVTFAVFAPAKTPAAIINRLNQEIVRFLNTAEAKEKYFSIGIEPIGSSPEQLTATMKSEMARMSKVIKDAGIHDE